MVNPAPIKERSIIRNTGILFDFLADGVDKINEIFSKQVKQKLLFQKFFQKTEFCS